MLPEILRETVLMNDDDLIILYLFVFHCMNYNSFLTTLLVIPPITLIPYYFQLTKEAEIWTDPFTGIPLRTQEDRDNFFWLRFPDMAVAVALIVAHSYLI